MMRIGAHVPTRGGLLSIPGHARDRGADAVQVFASNPQGWAAPRIEPREAAEFRDTWTESGLGPLFVHAPYLVNIASPNRSFHRKSIDLAKASLAAAEEIGADGLVVHSGSGGPGEPEAALGRAAAALEAIAATGSTALVVELTAGGSGAVAGTFAEARRLFDAVPSGARLKLCADTCHLFARGYRLDTRDGVAECFAELRRVGLARRLVLVHANDAKFPAGSRRDRHENVGQGLIGRDGFRAILADPAVRRAAVVCETPGTVDDHRADVATLRELAG